MRRGRVDTHLAGEHELARLAGADPARPRPRLPRPAAGGRASSTCTPVLGFGSAAAASPRTAPRSRACARSTIAVGSVSPPARAQRVSNVPSRPRLSKSSVSTSRAGARSPSRRGAALGREGEATDPERTGTLGRSPGCRRGGRREPALCRRAGREAAGPARDDFVHRAERRDREAPPGLLPAEVAVARPARGEDRRPSDRRSGSAA